MEVRDALHSRRYSSGALGDSGLSMAAFTRDAETSDVDDIAAIAFYTDPRLPPFRGLQPGPLAIRQLLERPGAKPIVAEAAGQVVALCYGYASTDLSVSLCILRGPEGDARHIRMVLTHWLRRVSAETPMPAVRFETIPEVLELLGTGPRSYFIEEARVAGGHATPFGVSDQVFGIVDVANLLSWSSAVDDVRLAAGDLSSDEAFVRWVVCQFDWLDLAGAETDLITAGADSLAIAELDIALADLAGVDSIGLSPDMTIAQCRAAALRAMEAGS